MNVHKHSNINKAQYFSQERRYIIGYKVDINSSKLIGRIVLVSFFYIMQLGM